MKTKLNYLFLMVTIIGALYSCEKEDTEVMEPEAQLLTANLSECVWAPFNSEDDALLDLRIDFSNSNIEVRNADEEVIDEGSWSVENEALIFENLSGVLAAYNASWNITEDRDGFLEIENGETTVNFEQVCN